MFVSVATPGDPVGWWAQVVGAPRVQPHRHSAHVSEEEFPGTSLSTATGIGRAASRLLVPETVEPVADSRVHSAQVILDGCAGGEGQCAVRCADVERAGASKGRQDFAVIATVRRGTSVPRATIRGGGCERRDEHLTKMGRGSWNLPALRPSKVRTTRDQFSQFCKLFATNPSS